MADMNEAISLTLQHEGGYVDNPEDAGGATNMGIEQRDLPDIPIKDLTTQQAIAYYQEHYWKPWMAEINSQNIINKIFDMGVLLGIQTAVRLLQRAIGFSAPNQDGDFGPMTLSYVNQEGDLILPEYKKALTSHFQWIVSQNPSQQEFLDGWINRVNS